MPPAPRLGLLPQLRAEAAASCWAAPASRSRCSTPTTPSRSWPSCASCARRGRARDEGASTSTPPPAGAGARTRCCSPPGAWPRAATRSRVACRARRRARGARARGGRSTCAPVAFRGDLWPRAASCALARGPARLRARTCVQLHDPHARLGGPRGARASAGARAARRHAPRGLPAARPALAREVPALRPRDRGEPRDRRRCWSGRPARRAAARSSTRACPTAPAAPGGREALAALGRARRAPRWSATWRRSPDHKDHATLLEAAALRARARARGAAS